LSGAESKGVLERGTPPEPSTVSDTNALVRVPHEPERDRATPEANDLGDTREETRSLERVPEVITALTPLGDWPHDFCHRGALCEGVVKRPEVVAATAQRCIVQSSVRTSGR